jgi:diguanylate cyclase (GGDEF)-like protein
VGEGKGKTNHSWLSREDSFRGADLELARKASKVGWPVGALLGYSLTPFYQPTASAIGNLGWAVTGFDALVTFGWICVLFRFNERVTFNVLLFTAYLGLANVVIAQWLAGGLPAPYHELYPVMILAAAAVHPPRRFLPFMLVMTACAILPEVGHASAAQIGDLVAELVLWVGASFLIVGVMWRIRQQRADREESHAEAHEAARVDLLTRLGNRRAFEEAMALEMERAAAENQPLSLLVCDLDRFKEINDRYGHLAGDNCLRQVAAALRNELRGADKCFRWGGDEFVVVLPETNELAALDVGARIERKVAQSCARPDETPLLVTTGHGTMLDWMSSNDLLAEADRALLARKGRSANPQPAS